MRDKSKPRGKGRGTLLFVSFARYPKVYTSVNPVVRVYECLFTRTY
jgi:hypothetical protein